MEKLTNVKAMEQAILIVKENNGSVELVEKLEKLKNQLSKKSTSHTTSPKAKANEALKLYLIQALEKFGKPLSISEMQKEDKQLQEYSNQKLSFLLNQLANDGLIIKSKDKNVSKFAVRGGEENVN